MRRSLFWRTYSVLLVALLTTIAIFTGVLTAARRQAMQESYESEVRLQAREVADYMANLSTLSYVQNNATMKYIIRRKIADIYSTYNAGEERRMRALAAKYNLLISGGSDFHGANKPDIQLGTGCDNLHIPLSVLEKLAAVIGEPVPGK